MVVYYKSYRYIDGNARWIVTDEYNNIIDKSPTREMLKIAEILEECKKVCSKCGRNWTSGVWYNNESRNGKLCSRCHHLSRSSARGLGFIGARIIAKHHYMEDCEIKANDLCYYVDLSNIEYGLSEIKTRSLITKYNMWPFAHIKPWNFDTLFLVCMDEYKPWKNVVRVYIIPSEYIDVENITIYNTMSTRLNRWHEFQIDEKSYNDIYHNMKLDNCEVLRR